MFTYMESQTGNSLTQSRLKMQKATETHSQNLRMLGYAGIIQYCNSLKSFPRAKVSRKDGTISSSAVECRRFSAELLFGGYLSAISTHMAILLSSNSKGAPVTIEALLSSTG